MPRYDARCDNCSEVTEYFATVSECLVTPHCARCGGATRKVILRAPTGYVKGKFEAFKSVVDGSIIASDRDMREHNSRNGVVNLADGYDDATVRSGDFGKKEVTTPKDISADIGDSIRKLNDGYKPHKGVYNEHE